jgi:N-acetylneuraminic acid mutarotase
MRIFRSLAQVGVLVVALAAISALVFATSTAFVHGRVSASASRTLGAVSPAPAAWRVLPPAPIAPGPGVVSVWTARNMIVFGRAQRNPRWSVDVAAAYDPATGTWRKLSPLPGDKGNYEGHYSAVWTGKEMLVFGPFDNQAFDPSTNRWRRLPARLPGEFGLGVVIWTGREAIAWGGGCCGDASSSGGAYDPSTNTWSTLSRSPLAPTQAPTGAWTGRELIVFVTGLDPDGKPYPTSFARAAAYDPGTDTWRRIAPPPASRAGAEAVWDGREVILLGGAVARRTPQPWPLTRSVLAYNPTTNRWRRLAPMESGRTDFAAVWTGKRLLVWGGRTWHNVIQRPPRGYAYDPATNRWSRLPQAPLRGRSDPAVVWTGKAMIVWGGGGLPEYRGFTDGAAFTPATR